MNKRDFLHVLGAGALGATLPGTALAQEAVATPAAPAAAAPVKKAVKPAAPAKAAAPAKPAALPSKLSLKGVDVAGKVINLDDYLGKACLVSFFTAECIPCTNDLRLMREFFGANKSRGYINIAVNMDVDRASLVAYMDVLKKTIPVEQHFPIVWRNAKEHSDNFGVITSQPTHIVLDKEHKLVSRRDGIFKPGDWDDLWSNLG